MSKTVDPIEKLLKDQETVKGDSVKKALELFQTEQDEKQTRKTLEELREIQRHVDKAVFNLREARRVEKIRKAYLEKLDKARKQYVAQEISYEDFYSTL